LARATAYPAEWSGCGRRAREVMPAAIQALVVTFGQAIADTVMGEASVGAKVNRLTCLPVSTADCNNFRAYAARKIPGGETPRTTKVGQHASECQPTKAWRHQSSSTPENAIM